MVFVLQQFVGSRTFALQGSTHAHDRLSWQTEF